MKLKGENKAGIYFTMIVHIMVIIFFLVYNINSITKGESSFVLDFSKQEEVEKLEKELLFKESISKRLDELIANHTSSPSSQVRNVAVNASLKDDRNTDAEKLYKDAKNLADALKKDNSADLNDKDDFVDLNPQSQKKDKKTSNYKGPSVVSYSLDGRKASRLSIPAYRCYAGGEVTVMIQVNNSGVVTNAKVISDISSSDKCLQEYAKRAARLSRFSIDRQAPPKHIGEIVYKFIAQ